MDSLELLADFQKALSQFQAALRIPAENDVIKAGCIQYAGYPLNASRLYRLCFPPTMCRYVAGVAAADCSMRR
jgi:hypothetical protein